jgi:hypothetical protein
MGDLWQENILIDPHQHPPHIYILDWEFTGTGLPGSEIGLFCANLDLLGRGNQAVSGPASAILHSFLDSYSRISNPDARLAQDALAHWGINYVFCAPRDPPGDRELVHELVREGVRFLVQSRDKYFLARSPVKGLLPKSMEESVKPQPNVVALAATNTHNVSVWESERLWIFLWPVVCCLLLFVFVSRSHVSVDMSR